MYEVFQYPDAGPHAADLPRVARAAEPIAGRLEGLGLHV
jgi:hypothetical protein